MAKLDKKLYESVRAKGVRKRVARTVAEASNATGSKKAPDTLRDAVKDLRKAAADLEDRATGGPEKRKRAGQKAARTRKKKAEQRSAAAKKAARTRARS